MNDLVKKNAGALAGVNALKKNLTKAKTHVPDVSGSQFLRFLQDGNWVFGQENEEVLPDDKAAFNPLSIKTGWSCWTDRPGKGAQNENLGESMTPLGQDPIPKSDLPVKTDPKNGNAVCEWREQISVDVKFLSGPHKGKQVLYKTTALGGIRAMRDLIDQIIARLDEDPENIVPVVSLDGDHYTHKAYGRTYTPILNITDWVSMDGTTTGAPEDEEPEDEEPEDEAPEEEEAQEGDARDEEAQEDEAPVRRRRRR